MQPQAKCQKKKPSATVSKPPQMNQPEIHLPNFNIEPVEDFDTIDGTVLAELMQDFPINDEDQQENADPNKQVTPQLPIAVCKTVSSNQMQKASPPPHNAKKEFLPRNKCPVQQFQPAKVS